MNSAGAEGIAAIFGMGYLIFIIVMYVYLALALSTIAKKTNTPNEWLAWIPIANIVLMLQIAQKPIWWIVGVFIPCVNIICLVFIWMGIAERRGKPGWWGVLIIVPCVNLFLPGYLAWAD